MNCGTSTAIGPVSTGGTCPTTSTLLCGVGSYPIPTAPSSSPWFFQYHIYQVVLVHVVLVSMALHYLKPILLGIKRKRDKQKRKHEKRKEQANGVSKVVVRVLLSSQEALNEIMDTNDIETSEVAKERIEGITTEIDTLPSSTMFESLKKKLHEYVSRIKELKESSNEEKEEDTGPTLIAASRVAREARALNPEHHTHNELAAAIKGVEEILSLSIVNTNRFDVSDIVPIENDPLGIHQVTNTREEIVGVRFHARTKATFLPNKPIGQRVKTIHIDKSSGSLSLKEWVQKTRRDIQLSERTHSRNIYGYIASPNCRALVLNGDLVPMEDYLRHSTSPYGLAKVDLVTSGIRDFESASQFILDKIGIIPHSDDATKARMWLLPYLHYNRSDGEIVMCGDLAEWERDDTAFTGQVYTIGRKLLMYRPTMTSKLRLQSLPRFVDQSQSESLQYVPMEKKKELLKIFYAIILKCRTNTAERVPVPFFMRGIHVDPRIHKPCQRNWCSPGSTTNCLWNSRRAEKIKIPPVRFANMCNARLQCATDKHPPHLPYDTKEPYRFLDYFSDSSPFSTNINWFGSNSLNEYAYIWFANSGRILTSPQFCCRGLDPTNVVVLQSQDWKYSWSISPTVPLASKPEWKVNLSLPSPYIDREGCHLPLSRWETDPPEQRAIMCSSGQWKLEKSSWFEAEASYWNEEFYNALWHFHSSLGFDPQGTQVAELLGLPILDPEDFLHTQKQGCLHATSYDTRVVHHLTDEDTEITWDPPLPLSGGFTNEGTSAFDKEQIKTLGLPPKSGGAIDPNQIPVVSNLLRVKMNDLFSSRVHNLFAANKMVKFFQLFLLFLIGLYLL